MTDTAAFPPIRKDRVCLLAFMAKKPGLTDEEFSKYWHEVHGPLFANLDIVKKNILKYEQHHYNDAFEQGAKAMGFDIVSYRGVIVFEAESYEKIMEVFQSEEYERVIFPDEPNFVDRSKTGFFPGPFVSFIDRK